MTRRTLILAAFGMRGVIEQIATQAERRARFDRARAVIERYANRRGE